MVTKYKLVDWSFDSALWSSSVRNAADEIGTKDLAQLLDVSPTTIVNWANGNYKSEFPWPHMLNLLKVCNLLDLDPRAFFILEEK
jgi:DNA-binding XRE family transcriptional regulator